jgi:hydroxymethylbilane synthase
MSDSPVIRIGTRSSELATWQAQKVADELADLGCKSKLVFITSEGDRDQTTPLPEMGGKGVFTKAVDEALLNNEIDVGVHSYKDLPTDNPLPLKVAAVMERADPRDTLVASNGAGFLDNPDYKGVIATGSNRRRAQWLNRYPNHRVVNLRGNVNTRLEKVHSKGWDGAIFAAAGLLRINLGHHISQYLDWMISAPAQGAMAVMVREEDSTMQSVVSKLNHHESELCTGIEREFLNVMEAGCSAPVGAFAEIIGNKLHLKATALTLDGEERFDFEQTVEAAKAKGLGTTAARKMLDEGAAKVMEELKS